MAGGRDMDIEINKTIHERARLMILTYVATREETPVPFNEIKSALNMTGGNLSVQLRNLEEAGYVEVFKTIEKRKTVTRVSLTPKGYEDLLSYLDTMEKLIKDVSGAIEERGE